MCVGSVLLSGPNKAELAYSYKEQIGPGVLLITKFYCSYSNTSVHKIAPHTMQKYLAHCNPK